MVTAVIPARLASTRLPNKLLLDLGGKPILQHVWQRVGQMKQADEIYIATDSQEIFEEATSWGATVLMTSPDCPSGTYRIASILDQMAGDFFLNVQGDEPFLEPTMLDGLVNLWKENKCDLVTAIAPITDSDALFDPNQVKAVINHQSRVLYFSRSPIPFIRDLEKEKWVKEHTFWGHIGVYGYQRDTLLQYPSLAVSALETQEKLEQLRFLDHNFSFFALKTDYHPIGIDTAADLEAARKRITSSN